ncbi:MAG: OsmC family protein [Candidatus Omnitrophica bacterium]|nr:OsmC family protein [Candidatus Omnitrophota bacterium]
MYHVDIEHTQDMVFSVRAKGKELLIDAKGSAMTPPDVLLAALGSCVGVYLRKYAEGAKLDLANFTVSVEAEFSKEPPVGFKEIKVAVDLKGAVLDDRRKQALLTFVKNCPVHNTLKLNPTVDIVLH